jgi:hypothetical protein
LALRRVPLPGDAGSIIGGVAGAAMAIVLLVIVGDQGRQQ